MTKTRILFAIGLAILLAGPVSAGQAASMTTRALAQKLPVRAENGAGYTRTAFRHWIDADHDGCDTREEVLIAESEAPPAIGKNCRITVGKWTSWYDGKTWTRPADVDIDHVVPLKEAWASGARTWSKTHRMRYANDLDFAWSLDAVTDNVNSSKGDRDPAEWLPPITAKQCSYAVHWVAIKYRWRLSIDARERTALLKILSGKCGSQSMTMPRRAL